MCGRFAFFSPADAVSAAFGFPPPAGLLPRYNIAPGQKACTIIADAHGQPVWAEQQWGLVPFWAKDAAIGNRLINARAETLAEKPSYRQSFRRRRCLVPASGFYEWRKERSGPKTPFFICRDDGQPLLMAGIHDVWRKGEGEPLHTFSIITRPANEFMQPLHERMPVLFGSGAIETWLAVDAREETLQGMLRADAAPALRAWAVSRKVNNPLNDTPELIEPAG